MAALPPVNKAAAVAATSAAPAPGQPRVAVPGQAGAQQQSMEAMFQQLQEQQQLMMSQMSGGRGAAPKKTPASKSGGRKRDAEKINASRFGQMAVPTLVN